MTNEERKLFRVAPLWVGDQDEPTPYRALLRKIAGSLREASAALTDTVASAETLEEIRAKAAELCDLLASAPQGRERTAFGQRPANDLERAYLDVSPVLGLANPVAPPVRLAVDGESIAETATFGMAYEGPPGHVHGGFIAAAFDDVLGATQSATGRPGMTATLEVRYRKPVPLGKLCEFRGTVASVEGRKIVAKATLHVAGELCAEATGTFIWVDFREMHLRDKAGRDQDR